MNDSTYRCQKCETWIDSQETFVVDGMRCHDSPGAAAGVPCGPVREVVVDQGKPWRWKDEPEKLKADKDAE